MSTSTTANDPPGDDIVSEYTSESSVTCSLASTRMSPNQTCDDLPGPGRLIDTYIYQPGGRYLERQINRVFAPKESPKLMTTTRKSQLKWFAQLGSSEAKHVINATFDAIDSLFEPISLRTSRGDEYSCQNAYWTRISWMSIKLDLSDYLYIWGAQDFADWDLASLVTHCAYVMSLIRSRRSNIRIVAITAAFFLVDSVPRLRQYFDLQAIRHAMHDVSVFNAVLHNIVQKFYNNVEFVFLVEWKLGKAFAEGDDIDYLVQRTSDYLPRVRIPSDDIAPYKPVLLSLIIEGLRSEESEIPQYRIPTSTVFISQLLRIPALFSFHSVDVDWMDPVVVFWRNIKDLIYKLPLLKAPIDNDSLLVLKMPRTLYRLVFELLLERLADTLHAFHPNDQSEPEDGDELTAGFAEDFARLCLIIQMRISGISLHSADRLLHPHGDEEESESIAAMIASRLALESAKSMSFGKGVTRG